MERRESGPRTTRGTWGRAYAFRIFCARFRRRIFFLRHFQRCLPGFFQARLLRFMDSRRPRGAVAADWGGYEKACVPHPCSKEDPVAAAASDAGPALFAEGPRVLLFEPRGRGPLRVAAGGCGGSLQTRGALRRTLQKMPVSPFLHAA